MMPGAFEALVPTPFRPDKTPNRGLSCRADLELVRTMADQVRRRERLKRRQLLLWRQVWRARFASPATALAALPRVPPAAQHGLQVWPVPQGEGTRSS